MFFFLAQTEQGDIFKITLDTDEDMVSPEWFKYWKNIMMICLKHMICLHTQKNKYTHALFAQKWGYTCYVYTHTKTHVVVFLHRSEDTHVMFTQKWV